MISKADLLFAVLLMGIFFGGIVFTVFTSLSGGDTMKAVIATKPNAPVPLN